jgi:peptidoglycan/LPS O-acetylase OafA/YrhL
MPFNPHIQSLRGLAIVLLVLYKVVGTDPYVGLQVADGPLRWFNDGLAYLRMPLFTVLSGLVYGMRPLRAGDDSRAFLLGKARRLLLPMLVVGTLFALLQSVTPGTHGQISNWWLLHIVPVNHLWYCEALCWIFLLVWLLERLDCISRPGQLALVWAAAALVHLFVPGTPLLAIEGTLYLLPYFLVGLAVSRFGIWMRLEGWSARALLLLLAWLAVWQLGMPTFHNDRRTALTLLAGLALCGLVLGLRLRSGWLERLGHSSYPIFLYHIFFTAASRIALDRLGLESLQLKLLAGLTLGLVGPLLVERLASRQDWSALWLLGQSRSRSSPNPEPVPS